MWEHVSEVWLPRLLFVLTLSMAGSLAALTVAAPSVSEPPEVLRLLAEDATVRRTSYACATGLAVTAGVFFRPTFRKKKSSRSASSSTMAGA